MPSRREFLAASATVPFLTACNQPADVPRGVGLGFFAKNLATGAELRSDEGSNHRFAFCSAFKFILAGFVLDDIEAGRIERDLFVPYSEEDFVPYRPVTEARVAEGGMPVLDLCQAVVEISDNVAANLLLEKINGPEGFTQRLRAIGDDVTRLDRWETSLNENLPGDPRDTTTPEQMVRTMETLLYKDGLMPAAQAQTKAWMNSATTGLARLRDAWPTKWYVGDKTGNSGNGAFNDVAFADTDQGSVLVASFIQDPNITRPEADRQHREVGARIAAWLQG